MSQIHIRPSPDLWSVHAGGALIGRSARAVEVAEGSYAGVLYLPRDDVAMDLLERSTKVTHCPHKGDAAHYAIITPAGRLENAVWSYETPKQHLGAIAGHLAFYPNRVVISRG